MEEGSRGAGGGLGGVSGDKAEGIGANVRYWLLRVAPFEPDAGDPRRVVFQEFRWCRKLACEFSAEEDGRLRRAHTLCITPPCGAQHLGSCPAHAVEAFKGNHL
jgi:hypothetical protein